MFDSCTAVGHKSSQVVRTTRGGTVRGKTTAAGIATSQSLWSHRHGRVNKTNLEQNTHNTRLGGRSISHGWCIPPRPQGCACAVQQHAGAAKRGAQVAPQVTLRTTCNPCRSSGRINQYSMLHRATTETTLPATTTSTKQMSGAHRTPKRQQRAKRPRPIMRCSAPQRRRPRNRPRARSPLTPKPPVRSPKPTGRRAISTRASPAKRTQRAGTGVSGRGSSQQEGVAESRLERHQHERNRSRKRENTWVITCVSCGKTGSLRCETVVL